MVMFTFTNGSLKFRTLAQIRVQCGDNVDIEIKM